MQIEIIKTPYYKLGLTVDEIKRLWELCYFANQSQIKNANEFYNKLEDLRPAGGFK